MLVGMDHELVIRVLMIASRSPILYMYYLRYVSYINEGGMYRGRYGSFVGYSAALAYISK